MNVVLTSVLTVSGIAGGLALMLSIANRTIGNYGSKSIQINENKVLQVEGGNTLLSTLMDEGIFIPSACGGKGSCGYCKVKVVSGGGQILPTELGYVTPEEQKDAVRLACQCKVKEDLHIEIPENLFNVKQQVYTLSSGSLVTPTIRHLKLKLPAEETIDFKAGQYIQILAPIYKGNDEEVYRAYSVASSPNLKDGIELFIGYVEGGKCSTYVHQHLKENGKLTIIGPFGDFHYIHSDRPMILGAIGTGLAPIMSILRYMAEEGIDREVTFYFGARCLKDLYMMDELRAIEAKLPRFTLIPCLTRPEPEDNWTGELGRINIILEKRLENASLAEAYLCGSPAMVDAVSEVLRQKGMPEEQIYYDKFD